MQRESLYIEGFLAYEEPVTISYNSGDITAITGRNGSGKTSIPDAIAWVRYGSLRVQGDSDSVINDFCEEAHVVETVVDNQGHRWKFDRKKVREKAQVLSVFSWNNATESWDRYGTKRIADNQKIINSLVGLNLEAFYSLNVFESRTGSRGIRLVSSKSDARIGILTSLRPGLAIWPAIHKNVSAQLREAKRRSTVEEEILSTMKSDMDELVDKRDDLDELTKDMGSLESIDSDLESARAELNDAYDKDSIAQLDIAKANRDKVIAQRNQKLQDSGSKISEVQSLIGQVTTAHKHKKSLSEEIAEIEEQIKEVSKRRSSTKQSVKRLQEKVENLKSDSSHAAEKIASLQSAREALEAQIDDLEDRLRVAESSDGKCLVCGSSISHEKSEEIISTINSDLDNAEDKLEDSEKDIKEQQKNKSAAYQSIRKSESSLKAAQKQLEESDDQLVELNADLRDAKRALAEVEETIENEGNLDDLKEELEELRENRLKIEDRYNKKENKYKKEIQRIKDEMPRSNDIRALERAIERIQAERDNFISSTSQLTQLSEQIESKSKGIQEQSESVESALELVNDLMVLREATSQRGIPYLMLTDMLTNVEVKADEFLELINSDTGKMTVDLVQNYEGKPTLDIMVTMSDGSVRPVEALSNGEVTRVSLALMFALAHVVNMSSANTVTDVFLDEPLAAIDDVGIEGVMVAAREAIRQKIVKSVMIVAHDRNIINACDNEVAIDELKTEEEAVV